MSAAMPEFRQNPVTGEWVIVAQARVRRPFEFRAEASKSQPAEDVKDCPFCPGHEQRTPPEVYAVRDDYATADGEGWRVRVVPNKYPALRINAEGVPTPESIAPVARDGEAEAATGPKGSAAPRPRPGALESGALESGALESGALEPGTVESRVLGMAGGGYGGLLRVSRPGIGMHEVVIESPAHETHFAFQDDRQAELIVHTLRHRCRMIVQARDVKYVCIFKNHGPRSGASVGHPHFQIIAPAVIPPAVKVMIERQASYAKKKGRAMFDDLLEEESTAGERIVATNDGFVALAPWASRLPYEVWIIPRGRGAMFGDLPDEHVALLASMMRDVLRRLHQALDDPDYHLVIHSSPKWRLGREFHRWFVEVTPRVVTPAGFEFGTGMYVNQTPPEAAAAALRKVVSAVDP